MSEQPEVPSDYERLATRGVFDIRTTHFEPLRDAIRELLQAALFANIAGEHASPSAMQFIIDARNRTMLAERLLTNALNEVAKER